MSPIDRAHAHLAGELNSTETAEYLALLATSEEHAVALAEAKRMRALMKEARSEAEALAKPGAFVAPEPSTPFRWWVPVGAFSLAILCLAILIERPAPPRGGTPPAQTKAPALPAPLILADGSRIEMTDQTRVEHVRGEADEIIIRLHRGQVTAEVVPDPTGKRTFLIHAGETQVAVLGTRFSVEWDGSSDPVEVVVERGRVLVTSPDASRELAAGESARFPSAIAPPVAVTRAAPVAPSAKAPETAADPSPAAEPRMRRRAERRAPSPSDEPGTPVAINESAGASVVAPAIQPAPPASAEPASVEISLVSDPVTNEMVSMIRSVGSHGCVAMLPRFEAFMRANAAHRHAIDALYLKGYCLYRMGNQDEAVRIWKKVERRQPKSPWLRTVRDWTQPRLPDVSRLR